MYIPLKSERKIAVRKFKFAAKLIAASMAAVSLSLAVLGAELTDISGHWSEEYVKYGVENGYISGYPDGTFLPDKSVTRAEFSKMVNSALGITNKLETSFPDVGENEWFHGEVGKALYAGYVSGYEDGTFRAANNITRQEAAVILSRIATRAEENLSVDSFSDSKDIADWAKSAMDYAYSKGFFGGDDLGRLNPKATLTRAQAAKILNKLRTEENVVNGDYTVDLVNGVCSETIFTDDVYFTATGEEPALLLDGCTVLGKIYLRTTDKSAVTIENSAVNGILADAAYAAIALKDGSSVKEIVLENAASVSGDGVGNIVLKGSGLASETTEILASDAVVSVYSDAVIKATTIKSMKLYDGVSLIMQGGSIEKMVVDKAAKGSVITLSTGVNIADLTVNAACSFMGTGTITKAENKVAGVTYTVKPEKLTGITEGSSDDGKEDNKNDTKDFAPVSVNPKMGESDVPTNVNFTVNFGEAVYDADGNPATEQYITNNVQFKRGASKVDFVAKLTSSSKFELDPTSMLAYDKEYTVIFPAGIFKDKNGNTNPKITYNFTTREDFDEDDYNSGSGSSGSSSSTTASTVKFSVESGEKDVSVNEELKVTFSDAIKRQSGSSVSDSFLSNTAFELREETKTGNRVGIIAEANSTKKTVTITPEQPLKPGVKYYLILVSGTLKFDGGSNISSKSVYFTTSDDLGMTISPKNGATGVSLDSKITIEFNSEIYLPDGSRIDESDLYEIIQLKEKSTSGKDVDFDVALSSDKKTITITPAAEFDAGITYYVTIPAGSIANEKETENKKFTSSFKTISEMQPELYPADGESEIDLSESVVIKFAEPVCKDKKGNVVDEEYITKLIDDKYITLYREGYTTNLLKSGEISISSDASTITIAPKKVLGSGKTYVLTVAAGKLWNETGKKSNIKATSTFSTPSSGIPEFNIEDGETGVAVDEKIEIQYDDVMRQVNGDAITNTYIVNRVVTIYKDSLDGETVAFTAKVDSEKLIITPKKDLAGGTTYYVVISAETMLNSDGKENIGYNISFTTEEVVEQGCTITPAHKATGVLRDTDITLEFNSKLCKKDGSEVSVTYLKNNKVFTLKNGTKDIPFTIEKISDDFKTVTITPTEVLEANTTYYVKVVKGSLYYFDGSLVDAESFNFKTGEDVSEEDEPVEENPEGDENTNGGNET